MAIFDLFSKRQKALRGEVPDVFQYEEIPDPLRVQVVYLWNESLGELDHGKAYESIVKILRKEYGVFELVNLRRPERHSSKLELSNFLLQEPDVERVLDAIELSFRLIDNLMPQSLYGGREKADKLIEELNRRFREHGVGYEYQSGEIIRVDSALIHSEAVKPALVLLGDKPYAGAQQEFLCAFEHYRKGNLKEAINECLKSFESTMKAICDKRKWKYQANVTAKGLIQVCFDNGLFPGYWQQQIGSLRSLLESGIPTGRNREAAHGQGEVPRVVPDHLVGYMLHMTASTIVFLARSEQSI